MRTTLAVVLALSLALISASCTNSPASSTPTAAKASTAVVQVKPVSAVTPTLAIAPTKEAPTATPIPPKTTPVPPTATPEPPTATSVPPTNTAVPPTATTETIALVPVLEVVDGDTIKVTVDGKTESIRIIGIDTPEVKDPRKPVQCFGQEASAKAHEMLEAKSVHLVADASQGDRDKYDRLLRYVEVDGTDFGLWMIQNGYAHEYTYDMPYERQAAYKSAQSQAMETSVGFWAANTCNGDTSQVAETEPTATSVPVTEATDTPAPVAAATATPIPVVAATATPKPAVQPTKQPATGIMYVLNPKSMVFHRPTCRNLPTKNRQDTTMTREEIVALGYKPCGNCDP